ncbi:MAG: hypothetical protein AAB383_03090 [Patescibacteria group bacterium]
MERPTEFSLEALPGVRGNVLDPIHPDPAYPFLGIRLNEGSETIPLTRTGIRKHLTALVRRFGVVAFSELTDQQRQTLNGRAFDWIGLPEREPFTRFPHYDEVGRRGVTILRKIKPVSSGVSTGFAGFLPGINAINSAAEPLAKLLEGSPWDTLIGEIVPPFKAMATEGAIYERRGQVSSFMREAVNTFHKSIMDREGASATVDAIQRNLATEGVHVDWSDTELLVFGDNILHWGAEGQLNGSIVFGEIW